MIAPATTLLLLAVCFDIDTGTTPACRAGVGDAARSATADPEPTAQIPSDEVLWQRRAVIGRVVVSAGDIFDPEDPREDRRPHRLANRLHRTTRESAIRQQLLFAPGDLYSPRLLEESERLLRQRRYLYDAEIRPTRYRDNRVDIEVVTRDVWTLSVSASFERLGGANTYALELQDSNFLGTGKDLALRHESTVDRTNNVFRYRDLNLLGSRARVRLLLADNSDGHQYELALGRPFYALDARWAGGLEAASFDRVTPLYRRGEITAELRHRQEFLEISGGLSRGLRRGRAWRRRAGTTYSRDLFSPAVGLEAPATLPADRTLIFPWLGFERVGDRYLETRDLDRVGRTEDVELGRRLTTRLGWSSPAFGGDRDRLIFAAGLRSAARWGDDHLLLLEAHVSGRWGSSGEENLVVGGSGRYYWRDWGRHVLFVHWKGDVASNLDGERQLLLGGDSGLRGYPLRYQDGDRRFLVTFEQRFYTPWELLRLVNVGAAVFADVGRAWFENESPDAGSGILKDIGFGLRLGSTRSGRGRMLHLDVAFPLDGEASIEGVQWIVTSKETF